MTSTTPDGIQDLLDSIISLKPFLISARTLEQDAGCLADFISGTLPLCRMALVRLDDACRAKEIAVWSKDTVFRRETFEAFLSRNLSSFVTSHQRGEPVSDARLAEMIREILGAETDLYEISLLPIVQDGLLLGFAFYGKQRSCGAWTQEEKSVLHFLTEVAGFSFTARNNTEWYRLKSWIFDGVMNSLRANLFITEFKTDRILFMNRTMKEAFGLTHPEGEFCWKILQKGQEGRCPSCPVYILEQSADEMPSCITDEVNTLNGRIYENYDSLMKWVDGSTVHFQQSVDVTESRLLAKLAATDDLTGMLNRRAGKEALDSTLKRARREGVPVTVCMYDLNTLKTINDGYGHQEGDFALRLISLTFKSVLEQQDYSFRLSGDEFIVVFYNCTGIEASQKIAKVKRQLELEKLSLKKPYAIGFCHGLAEVAPEDGTAVEELLETADREMYLSKKRFYHSMSQPAPLTVSPTGQGAPGSPFTYDTRHLYDALVQSTDDYIYVCNMATNTYRFPPAMVEEFGLPGEIIYDAAPVWGALVHENDREAFFSSMQNMADGLTDIHNVEYRAKNRRGEWVWLRCRGHLIREEDGSPGLFAGLIENLGRKNKIDHLTGLFNKFAFESQVEEHIRAPSVHSFGVVLLGLDDFKHINDLYNREFGDEVLRSTSQRILTLLPSNASLFRLDGDEFGLLVTNASDDEILKLYCKIRECFTRQQEYNGQKYYCTLSAGCSMFPLDGGTYLDLFKYAGYSLEYAKSCGKNRFEFCSKEILEHKSRSLELTELLRESVENEFRGFELYYQPQVHADSRRLVGAEALARWSCEKYGPVSPMEFIPLLEESGLILPVGKWIFEEAVAACSVWEKRCPGFTMSINLSYLQLTEEDFIRFMEETIKRGGVSPTSIVVELTESCIASGIGSLRRIFAQIRRLGVKIAMDDFGTGYSSLEILKNTPADIVKIDKAFVRDIQHSSFDATFIKFIVALCHDVDIEVCLEGVETEEEYRIVGPMELDFIQGYLFGRPISRDAFDALLASIAPVTE